MNATEVKSTRLWWPEAPHCRYCGARMNVYHSHATRRYYRCEAPRCGVGRDATNAVQASAR